MFSRKRPRVSVADVNRAAPFPVPACRSPARLARAAPVTGVPQRARLLRSALAAAARGWHVFPCAAGGKRPALRGNWQELATTSADQVRAWWDRAPYNVGI